MVTIRASIYDRTPELILSDVSSLDQALDKASVEARAKGKLNIVVLGAPNRDWLSLVVGGAETVVGFNYGHGNPPYYASVGKSEADEPVFTAFMGLEHHTEFPRRWVVPDAAGRQAAREFLLTGERPPSLQWVEV
jgi:immunity protein Imm1 of predicted polymorphic toxin system